MNASDGIFRRPWRRPVDICAGLWYPIIFASITAVVGYFFLPETEDVDITR